MEHSDTNYTLEHQDAVTFVTVKDTKTEINMRDMRVIFYQAELNNTRDIVFLTNFILYIHSQKNSLTFAKFKRFSVKNGADSLNTTNLNKLNPNNRFDFLHYFAKFINGDFTKDGFVNQLNLAPEIYKNTNKTQTPNLPKITVYPSVRTKGDVLPWVSDFREDFGNVRHLDDVKGCYFGGKDNFANEKAEVKLIREKIEEVKVKLKQFKHGLRIAKNKKQAAAIERNIKKAKDYIEKLNDLINKNEYTRYKHNLRAITRSTQGKYSRLATKKQTQDRARMDEFGGLLYYDIDCHSRENAIKLKDGLYRLLKKYENFNQVRFSQSGTGVHIVFIVDTFDTTFNTIKSKSCDKVFFNDDLEREPLYSAYYELSTTYFGKVVLDSVFDLMMSGEVEGFDSFSKFSGEELVDELLEGQHRNSLYGVVDMVSFLYGNMFIVGNDIEPHINPNHNAINTFESCTIDDLENESWSKVWKEKYAKLNHNQNSYNVEVFEKIYTKLQSNPIENKLNLVPAYDALGFPEGGFLLSESNLSGRAINISHYNLKNKQIIGEIELDTIMYVVSNILTDNGLQEDYLKYNENGVIYSNPKNQNATSTFTNLRRWVIPHIVDQMFGKEMSRQDVVELSMALCNTPTYHRDFNDYLLSKSAFLSLNSSQEVNWISHVLDKARDLQNKKIAKENENNKGTEGFEPKPQIKGYLKVKMKKEILEEILTDSTENIIDTINSLGSTTYTENSIEFNRVTKRNIRNFYNFELESDSANDKAYLGTDTMFPEIVKVFNKLFGMFLLWSGTGTGKTEFAKKYAKQYGATMIVLPYRSIMENKFKDSSTYVLIKDNVRLSDIEKNDERIRVLTYDKFADLNTTALESIDTIFLDESHELGLSSYRGSVSIKIKALLDKIRNNKKIIFTTATPFTEAVMFDNIDVIKVIKDEKRKKSVKITTAPSTADVNISLANSLTYFLENNNIKLHNEQPIENVAFVMINDGEKEIAKIVERISLNLGRTPKYTVYSSLNRNDKINKLITTANNIGDTELIFGTKFFEAGIDIEGITENVNTKLFVPHKRVIVSENNLMQNVAGVCPHNIVQFASRVRHKDIDVEIFTPIAKKDGGLYNSKNDINGKFRYVHRDDQNARKFIEDLIKIKPQGDMLEINNVYNDMMRIFKNKGFYVEGGDGNLSVPEKGFLGKIENAYTDHFNKILVIADTLKNVYGFDVSAEMDDTTNFKDDRKEQKEINKKIEQEHRELTNTDFIEVISLIKDDNVDIVQTMNDFSDSNNAVEPLNTEGGEGKIVFTKDEMKFRNPKTTYKLLRVVKWLLLTTDEKGHNTLPDFLLDKCLDKNGDVRDSLITRLNLRVKMLNSVVSNRHTKKEWEILEGTKFKLLPEKEYTTSEFQALVEEVAKEMLSVHNISLDYTTEIGRNFNKTQVSRVSELVKSFIKKETSSYDGKTPLYTLNWIEDNLTFIDIRKKREEQEEAVLLEFLSESFDIHQWLEMNEINL